MISASGQHELLADGDGGQAVGGGVAAEQRDEDRRGGR